MNKLDSQSTSLTLSPVSPSTPGLARWLIVLVPCIEADLTAATRRVWELANAGGKRVRFLGLYENPAQELSLRRQLAGMSAMVGSAGIYTETEAVFGKNWSEVVRSHWHEGDLVVCFSEQRAGPLNRSLSDVLQSSLNVPIYILSEMYLQRDTRFNWWTQIIAWPGFLVILSGFFLIQVRIHQLTGDWIRVTLILMSVCLETWMIWVWNKLFS